MDPLPKCQTQCLFRYFDSDFNADMAPCVCCYSCIARDAENGCNSCTTFLETYLPKRTSKVRSRSLRKGLKSAILELFEGLGISTIEIETRLSQDVENFASDFVKVYDEIDNPSTIQSLWHIPEDLANDLFNVSSEFLGYDAIVDEETAEEDFLDENMSAQSDLSDTDSISTVYDGSQESGDVDESD